MWLFGTSCTSTVHPAPPYSEIQSSISVFMGTKNTYDFESSNPTIGTPGQMLYGAENPERDLFDGDQGEVWHDANTMTMLADYQMAGDLLGVSTDNGSQSVVEAYVNKGYNVLVPFANGDRQLATPFAVHCGKSSSSAPISAAFSSAVPTEMRKKPGIPTGSPERTAIPRSISAR